MRISHPRPITGSDLEGHAGIARLKRPFGVVGVTGTLPRGSPKAAGCTNGFAGNLRRVNSVDKRNSRMISMTAPAGRFWS